MSGKPSYWKDKAIVPGNELADELRIASNGCFPEDAMKLETTKGLLCKTSNVANEVKM